VTPAADTFAVTVFIAITLESFEDVVAVDKTVLCRELGRVT
jgi:hypothetical protein